MSEELKHGPPYEPEVRQHDHMREEEEVAADGPAGRSSNRRVMSRGYDCLMAGQPDVFTAQLEELRQLEQELGHLPHKWTVHWEMLEPPPQDTLQVAMIPSLGADSNSDVLKSIGVYHNMSYALILFNENVSDEYDKLIVVFMPRHFLISWNI